MIALVLGAGVVGAVVRSDDSDGDSTSAVGGPNETVVTVTVPTGATTTAVVPTSEAPSATTTPAGGPATTAPTGGTGGTGGTATSTTVAATGSGSGSGGGGSGLGAEGAGEVAMGPTTPNTGAESLLVPGAGLVVSGAALRRMLRRR